MSKLMKNTKGFTLIEIIVVLVILAILAAAAIPTMLGFVNDSRAKALVAEARTCFIAAQAISTEEYSTGATDAQIQDGMNGALSATHNDPSNATIGFRIPSKFVAMLKPDITLAGAATITDADVTGVVCTAGKITTLTYAKMIDGSRTATIVLEPPKSAVVKIG